MNNNYIQAFEKLLDLTSWQNPTRYLVGQKIASVYEKEIMDSIYTETVGIWNLLDICVLTQDSKLFKILVPHHKKIVNELSMISIIIQRYDYVVFLRMLD